MIRRSKRLSWLRNRLVIGAFLLCITAPAVVGMFGITEIPQFTENRTLNPFPQLASGPTAFLRGLDSYISDHFGLRPSLITSISYAKFLMRVSTHPLVVFGRDGWVFLRCPACRGVDMPFTSASVESYARTFVERSRWVEGQGAHFTLFVAPRKEVVYSEYAPHWMQPAGPGTPIGLLREALRGDAIDLFYPRDDMIRGKARAKLFFRYDTHWTEAGALIGAGALIDHLHEEDPAVLPFVKADFVLNSPGPHCIKKYDGSRLDLLVLQGAPALSESCPAVARKGGWTTKEEGNNRGDIIYTKDDPSLPTAVFYVDSFGTALRRVVAESFRRTVFVHPWNGVQTLADQFPIAAVQEEKPNIVVYLRAEPALFEPTDNPPEVKSPSSPQLSIVLPK